jgi:hypothetical protein
LLGVTALFPATTGKRLLEQLPHAHLLEIEEGEQVQGRVPQLAEGLFIVRGQRGLGRPPRTERGSVRSQEAAEERIIHADLADQSRNLLAEGSLRLLLEIVRRRRKCHGILRIL